MLSIIRAQKQINKIINYRIITFFEWILRQQVKITGKHLILILKEQFNLLISLKKAKFETNKGGDWIVNKWRHALRRRGRGLCDNSALIWVQASLAIHGLENSYQILKEHNLLIKLYNECRLAIQSLAAYIWILMKCNLCE